MKLLTFTEMCAMPHGTVFQDLPPNSTDLGELCIWLNGREESCSYGYQPLAAEMDDLGHFKSGSPLGYQAYWPAFSNSTGGGWVEEGTRFLVYEAEDIERLIQALQNPAALNDVDDPLVSVDVPL